MYNFDLAIRCLPTLYFDYDNQSTLFVVLDGIDSQSPFWWYEQKTLQINNYYIFWVTISHIR
jgi:hypothetical protein